MNMDQSTAERWVTTSAAVVIAVYAYRRLIEPVDSPATLKKIAGAGTGPVSLGAFITAWGFVYMILSVITEAAPGLGGSFAILIATSDLLTNMPALAKDVTAKKTSATTAPAASSAASTTAAGNALVITGLTNPSPAASGTQQAIGSIQAGVGTLGTSTLTPLLGAS